MSRQVKLSKLIMTLVIVFSLTAIGTGMEIKPLSIDENQEGPDAPYNIRPQALSLSATPRRGAQFYFNLTGTARAKVCNFSQNWAVIKDNKTLDFFHGPTVTSMCYNPSGHFQWTIESRTTYIKLPASYDPGLYQFNIWINNDDGRQLDVYFVANI